jgi:hypothetical protein
MLTSDDFTPRAIIMNVLHKRVKAIRSFLDAQQNRITNARSTVNHRSDVGVF